MEDTLRVLAMIPTLCVGLSDTLRVVYKIMANYNYESVLILVLMEDTLRETLLARQPELRQS